jgi:secreted PhoX family phosphatase
LAQLEGEPVGVAGNLPAWKPNASNSAADQAVQIGMHHDGQWPVVRPSRYARRITAATPCA